MPRLTLPIALIMLGAGPRIVAAQTPAEAQARAVADSFFAATAAERWSAAAKLLDMGAFDRIFMEAQGNARAELPVHVRTVEELMVEDSMPRAVAEWFYARNSKYTHDPYEFLTYEFSRVSTPREFLALTASEAAERWLEAQDFRYLMRRAWKMAGCRGEMPASIAIADRRKILGIAIGNDSTAYVVHATVPGMVGGDVFGARPSIMVLTRRQGSWRIDPDVMRREGGMSFGPECAK
jgi:hypothetical protein